MFGELGVRFFFVAGWVSDLGYIVFVFYNISRFVFRIYVVRLSRVMRESYVMGKFEFVYDFLVGLGYRYVVL